MLFDKILSKTVEDVKMESSLTPRSLWFKDRTYDMVVQWIYAPLKDVWKASPLPKPAASLWTAKFHWNLVLEFVCVRALRKFVPFFSLCCEFYNK